MSTSTKRFLIGFLGAVMLLGVPACLQSSTDPGSELNPQPLPPQDPEKQGTPTTSPAPDNGGGSSSSGGSSGTAAVDADAGADASDAKGE